MQNNLLHVSLSSYLISVRESSIILRQFSPEIREPSNPTIDSRLDTEITIATKRAINYRKHRKVEATAPPRSPAPLG
jgi:hypothetical protein